MDENKALQMYNRLMAYAEDLHESNRKRITSAIVTLFILPVLLIVLMLMTDSSRILFLIIWIIGMFVIAAYLISIAYIDYRLQDMLNEILDMEKEYDDLMGYGPEVAQERFRQRHEKLQETQEKLQAKASKVRNNLEERKEERIEEFKEILKK